MSDICAAGAAGGIIEVRIGPNPPARLDKALARDVPETAHLSRTRIARLIAEGRVSREGRVVRDPAERVAEGQLWRIDLPASAPSGIAPEALPLEIVYEDEEILVVNKPAGMVVHPAPGARSGTLVNALLAHCGDRLPSVGGRERPGIVHRIDKDTSGLLVVARTDRAQAALAEAFARHDVERHYTAVVHGSPERAAPRLAGLPGVHFEEGGVLRIEAPIARHPRERQRMAVRAGGRRAVTRCRVQERFGEPPSVALLDCWLETGRTHQIRVHLAHVGHPLVGDPVYGRRRQLSVRALGEEAARAARDFPRQALHARTLGLRHPATGEFLRFEAPLPPDMAALVDSLRRAPRAERSRTR